MKSNMGSADRVIRALVAVVIVILYSTNQISGITAMVLLSLGGIFMLTSFISFCPLYFPFNISTRGRHEQAKEDEK
jgi:hypothetical protein